MAFLKAAEDYAELGWIPMALNGKVARTKKWSEDAVHNHDTWRKKVPKGHDGNIGVRTGGLSGVIVVDVDSKHHGLERWHALVDQHGEPLGAAVAKTGNGFHYYFRWDDRAAQLKTASRCGKGKTGIDVRAEGGYVVAPPSTHQETGNRYAWDVHPDDLEDRLEALPKWLYEELYEGQYGKAAVSDKGDTASDIWGEPVIAGAARIGAHRPEERAAASKQRLQRR